MAQKAVLKLDVQREKDKKKAMKIVSGFAGIDSISMSLKDGKLTVTGDFDPVSLVEKLRKAFDTHIESVGPAKEEKKGNDPAKKDDSKGGDDKKGDKVVSMVPYPFYPNPHLNYPPRQVPVPPSVYYDQHRSVEEDPNGCVIC